MHKTTKAEKAFAEKWIHRFVQANNEISLREFYRTMSWLNGQTFQQIAKDQGVSRQAVAKDVKRVVELVTTFGKESEL